MSYFVEVRPGDWAANRRNWERAGSIVFGPGASPTFTGLTLSGLTASTLIGANASKALESVTIGTGLDYTRPTLSLSHLGVEALTDPGADRIFFWDDSETASKWLTVSTGLQISTTNITTKDSEIVHDNLSGFVANEHIDHTSVTLTAGTGLTGGGDITANRTFAVDGVLEDLDTLGANSADSEFLVGTGAGALAWESGATARTSIGLGTTDTATFGKLVLNAASPNVLSVTASGDTNPVVTITGGSNTVLALINSGTVAYLQLSNSTEANNYVGSNGTGLEFWTENASRATINSAGLTLGTLELTCGSINRTTGTLTLEIGGTAEISITSTTVTLGGNLIIPDSGTIGSASDTDVMTIDASGNCTFSVFPITPSAAPDADYEVANKKYVDDNAGAGGGVVVQVVNTQTGAVSSGNTQLPCDDSVPQNTEGDEVMTLAITPTSSTNELKIEVTVALSASTADEQLAAALFQDTTASALAAVRFGGKNANEIYITTFTHYMTAGTTSETTFKIRVGPGTAATVTFNGVGGNRRLGGAFASSITITEIST